MRRGRHRCQFCLGPRGVIVLWNRRVCAECIRLLKMKEPKVEFDGKLWEWGQFKLASALEEAEGL